MRLKMKQGASYKREGQQGERDSGESAEQEGRERGKGLIILLLFHLLYINEQSNQVKPTTCDE
jgi:hypothetical protein